MENNHDIDKTFSEASQSLVEPATFPGFDKVWANVEEKLDQKEQRKQKRISRWLPYGIAASLLIASGIFYFTSTTEQATINKSIIAQNTFNEKKSSRQTSVQILKIDSVVRTNIQKDVLPRTSAKPGRNELPIHYIPVTAPSYNLSVLPASQDEIFQIAAEQLVMDSIKRQNIEEVIAMGIHKDKALMNGLDTRKKISALNVIADTAEYVSANGSSVFPEKRQEPEILYKKSSVKASRPLALNSGRKMLGEKQDALSLNGFRPGLSINSISGAAGLGRVDISIGYQENSQLGNEPLVVINGTVSDIEDLKKMDTGKIDNISVISKEKAGGLFGGKAKNGLIVVITKDISKEEKLKLRKLLEIKIPEGQE